MWKLRRKGYYQMQWLWQPSADAGSEPSETDRWTQQGWAGGPETQSNPLTTSSSGSACPPREAVSLLAGCPTHWTPAIQMAYYISSEYTECLRKHARVLHVRIRGSHWHFIRRKGRHMKHNHLGHLNANGNHQESNGSKLWAEVPTKHFFHLEESIWSILSRTGPINMTQLKRNNTPSCYLQFLY